MWAYKAVIPFSFFLSKRLPSEVVIIPGHTDLLACLRRLQHLLILGQFPCGQH
jgi:hypothetical protein